jgi:hypothetical protein
MEKANEELLKDKATTTENDLKQEPEEIKPEDADKVVGGMTRF